MNEERKFHFAQKTISDLRDHLSRHDKPIAFLFGAGTSSAVRIRSCEEEVHTKPLIPTVVGLTEISKNDAGELGNKYSQAWNVIEEHCKENNQDPNVENILSRLRMMASAVGITDTLSGLNKDEIGKTRSVGAEDDRKSRHARFGYHSCGFSASKVRSVAGQGIAPGSCRDIYGKLRYPDRARAGGRAYPIIRWICR